MTKAQYLDYLRYIYTKRDGDRLTESSVSHYGNEAMRLINDKLKSHYGDDFSIYEIDDIEELKRIKEFLFNEQGFYELNKRGNQMYSAGMNRYIEFAEGALFRGKQDIIKTLDYAEKLEYLPTYAKESKQHLITTPDRNRIKIIQSEQACNYTCQVDSSHKTFIVNRTDHQYMEGHHIIPLNEQKNFTYNLDCYANILVVCPTCHRFFHYADKTARDEKLKVVYEDRAERLEKSGIKLDWKEFIDVVDSRPSNIFYSYN